MPSWVSVVRASNLDAPIKANHAYFLVFAQWGQPLYDLKFRTCKLDTVTDFFYQVGHEIMYVSSENNHLFTK